MMKLVKRSGAILATSVLIGGMAILGSSAAYAADDELRVDIRAEMDLDVGDGPIVFEAIDVLVGPGPELTNADLLDNPSTWCGDIVIDIDPDASTITVSADDYSCFFFLTSVVITSDAFGALELVSDDLFASTGDGDFVLDYGVADGSAFMNWTSTAAEEYGVMSGTAVFSYTLATVEPEVEEPVVEEDEAEVIPAAPAAPEVVVPMLAESGAEAVPYLWLGLLLAAAGALAVTGTRFTSRTR